MTPDPQTPAPQSTSNPQSTPDLRMKAATVRRLRRRTVRQARRRWFAGALGDAWTVVQPRRDRWDEYTRAQVRLRYRKALRYGQIGVLAIAASMLVFAIFMVVGCFMSDLHIDRHYATTYARVEAVESNAAYVSFVDRSGRVINPDRGVFYPTGVHPGQQVRIDYDATNPNFVRISGRNWTLSLIPALSVLVCVLPWCLLAFAVLGRYRLKAGGRIRRTHWKGSIAGIHINTRPTILRLRAATAPPTKQVL